MAQYNIKIFKSALIGIIIILIALIAFLWLKQPSQSPLLNSNGDNQNNYQKQGNGTHQTTVSSDNSENQPKVDFDFYNLLSKPDSDNSTTEGKIDLNKKTGINETNVQQADQHTTMLPATSKISSVNSNVNTNHSDYILQVASLHDATAAVRYKQQLDALDYPVFIQTYQIEQQLWYRVIIGPYINKETAQSVQQQLQKHNIKSFLSLVSDLR